jgi:UDP-N-acetylglucosamine diphosphorylase/glucosamine-1-phosphate N-acetyltransferase
VIAVLVMAAGKGTRMNSDLPKVLHRIDGRPLIELVLAAARELKPDRLIVIVGHQREQVMREISDSDVEFAVQEPQSVTGHAVLQAVPLLNGFQGEIVILSGDVPLLRGQTLQHLVAVHRLRGVAATVLSTVTPDPTGYGRIVRDGIGQVVKIVEQRHATAEILTLSEINSGIYCFNFNSLIDVLGQVRADNTKGEYYLTDVIQILKNRGEAVQAVNIADFWEVRGINTNVELAEAEATFLRAKAMK